MNCLYFATSKTSCPLNAQSFELEDGDEEWNEDPMMQEEMVVDVHKSMGP